jgi:ABC-type polysaccharide/polyol phosphate transport system ATPase subunit
VSHPAILFDQVGKKFRRSLKADLLYGLQDASRSALRLKPLDRLRSSEFWALRDISFAAGVGECIGIIGPNGAGKSTLLKLVNRDYRPDQGRIETRGRVRSLIRLGTGLQPMLTGRENIYIQCTQRGLDKRETDAKLDEIVAFAGLERSLDAPVKHYSDGMYARLEFAIATCVPSDILLVDEVLAVGDIAFQMRCLERLDNLKHEGTTILFVSHSEMHVRHVADRCLLLFDGEALAFGDTDKLFLKYYRSIGYLDRQLKPLGTVPQIPADFAGVASIRTLTVTGRENIDGTQVFTGQSVDFDVSYVAAVPVESADLVLQFWTRTGLLVASIDSRPERSQVSLKPSCGRLRLSLPFLSLAPGIYRVAGGFASAGDWLGYSGNLLTLIVKQQPGRVHDGLFVMNAKVSDLDN